MSQFVIEPVGDSWELFDSNPLTPFIISGPTCGYVKERAFKTLRTRAPCRIRIKRIGVLPFERIEVEQMADLFFSDQPFEEWKLDSRQGEWYLNSYRSQQGDHTYLIDAALDFASRGYGALLLLDANSGPKLDRGA